MDPGSWERAKDIITAALDLTPPAREALIREWCADNPALADEILDMLRASTPIASDPLDNPIAPDPPVQPDPLDDLTPGTRVGSYTIVDRLGRGGMGQVFLASDAKLRRKVALKCLLDAPADATIDGGRMLDEARATARVTHPKVAVVYEVIEHGGRAFIVMEYVEGENLADRMRRGRLTLLAALQIGRQLASALGAAHAKAIVHRDLKPANIQLTPDGSVKVLDFGVAQVIAALSSNWTTTTNARVPGAPQPGTPTYMSPEQRLGGEIDHRSDLYSLGVVLYEMTTGHRPFPAADPLTLLTVAGERMVRADAVDPSVPRDVGDVIARAMARHPDQRFQTASEIESELYALMRVHEVDVVQPSPRDARVSRRTMILRRVGIALLASALVGFLGFLMTVAFNLTFDRVAPFDAEPPMTWLVMGVRSLVTPTIAITGVLLLASMVKFGVRILRLLRPIDHLLTTSGSRTNRMALTIGLNDPAVTSQAIAGVGLLAIALVIWAFSDLLWACVLSINLDPFDALQPLSPANADQMKLFRLAADLLVVGFGVSAVRVNRLRARQRDRGSPLPLIAVLVLLCVAMLLVEMPYRIMWHNEFERVDYGSSRCYLIGEHDVRDLMFCPDQPPPHNRIVERTDSRLRRLGIRESVFTRPDRSPPDPRR
jgi:serine/threonine protein kinase